MPTRDIRTRLILDGERKFSSEIQSAQRNLRTMRAELKAETAAFEANGQKQQANAARVRSLREQQDQQRKIIKALAGAVEDATKKYGESSTVTDGYRIKLANARAELTKMETAEKELVRANDKTKKSFSDLKKDIASGWGDVSKQVKSALGGITGVAAGVAASVATTTIAAGKQIYDWAVEASYKADDILTESLVTGIDAQTLQSWYYASNFIDTSVDSIVGSVERLKKNMFSDSDDVKEVFQRTGVRLRDTAQQYRNAQDVFWDIIDDVSTDRANGWTKYGSEVEVDHMLNTLFGKGYRDLAPLIAAGRAAWDDKAAEAFDLDFVLSDDQLEKFGDLNDKLQQISAATTAVHEGFANYFVSDFIEVDGRVADLLSTFNQFLHGDATAEDVAAEAGKVIDAVINAVTHGVELTQEIIDGLKASDDPNVRAVGDLLQGILDAGKALWDNKDNIVNAVKAIAGAWVGFKVAAGLTALATFSKNVASLTGNLIALIAQAGPFSAAMGQVAVGAEAAQTAAAATFAAASMTVGAAAMLAATTIGQGLAEEKAAEDMYRSIYDTTVGTDEEKKIAANYAAMDVREPGTTGAWIIAKAIAGRFEKKNYADLVDADGYIQAMGGSGRNFGIENVRPMSAESLALAKAAEEVQAAFDVGDQIASIANYMLIRGEKTSPTVALKNALTASGFGVQEGLDLQKYIELSNAWAAMGYASGEVADALHEIDAAYGGDILGNTAIGGHYMYQNNWMDGLDTWPDVIDSLTEQAANVMEVVDGLRLGYPDVMEVLGGNADGVEEQAAAIDEAALALQKYLEMAERLMNIGDFTNPEALGIATEMGALYDQYGSSQAWQDYADALEAQVTIEPAPDTESTINAALARMSFSAPLNMVPVASSYRMGTGYTSQLTNVISGTATANVNLNLNGKTLGTAIAPFVNNALGRLIG